MNGPRRKPLPRWLSLLITGSLGLALPASVFLAPGDWEEFRGTMVFIRVSALLCFVALGAHIVLPRRSKVDSWLRGALAFGSLWFLPWAFLVVPLIFDWRVDLDGPLPALQFFSVPCCVGVFVASMLQRRPRRPWPWPQERRHNVLALSGFFLPLVAAASLQGVAWQLERSYFFAVDIEDPESFESALRRHGPWIGCLNMEPLVFEYIDEPHSERGSITPRSKRIAAAYLHATGKQIRDHWWVAVTEEFWGVDVTREEQLHGVPGPATGHR